MKTGRKHLAVLIMTLFLLILRHGHTLAQGDESARLMALGGSAVEGIIPDFYTDFLNNPAVLAGRGSSGALYRLISYDMVSIPLYKFNREWELSRPHIAFRRSINALDLFWDRGSGSWKFALSGRWAFGRGESVNPTNYINDNDYRLWLRENGSDFWKIDITAATKTKRDVSIGIRAGSMSGYDIDQGQTLEYEENYRSEDATPALYGRSNRDHGETDMYRVLSGYVECGLRTEEKRGSFSEIALKFAAATNTIYSDRWRFNLYKYYDEYNGSTYLTDQRLDSYNFSSFTEGGSWAFTFRGRHRTSSGFMLSGTGTFERCTFDGSRRDKDEDFDYDYMAEDAEEYLLSIHTGGAGTFERISGVIKAGKRFPLTDDINLYLGFAAFGSHIGWNYDPVLSYRLSARENYDSFYEKASGKSNFSRSVSSGSLYIPASLEFRAASFLTLFSSFTPSLSAVVTSDGTSFPDYGLGEVAGYLYYGDITTREIYTGRGIKTGFRINYREKLLIDLYAGSNLFVYPFSYFDINVSYLF